MTFAYLAFSKPAENTRDLIRGSLVYFYIGSGGNIKGCA